MNIFIIAAITVDGFIAQTKEQNSTGWTSREDTKFFMKRTKEAGALVMGSTTFATIGKPLPGRKIYVYTSNPENYEEFHPDQIEPVSMDPIDLVGKVQADGYSELAVCGGASIYTQFMEAEVVNALYLTMEPVLFGDGIKLFSNALPKTALELQQLTKLSAQTFLLEYKVAND